ncbi:unnamed protein product [Acanthoscelides obtectus]|uniref:Uncharacterized protein n=1 Tax=Acanthoscelides obtectus TaxID=200917 RepID=A0A9P0L3L9_ACAOB|nr:unnamed protein product [Acanthoscelides obtectus]CAK1673143.1 hypothetical protein AOBTE_LOCUS29250 [Acanthoscelides obtectus]
MFGNRSKCAFNEHLHAAIGLLAEHNGLKEYLCPNHDHTGPAIIPSGGFNVSSETIKIGFSMNVRLYSAMRRLSADPAIFRVVLTTGCPKVLIYKIYCKHTQYMATMNELIATDR